jgi:hypothetical protein
MCLNLLAGNLWLQTKPVALFRYLSDCTHKNTGTMENRYKSVAALLLAAQ